MIHYTEDQQVLNAIIRDRYGHTFSLLSVSSITANVKFRSAIDTEFKAWGESGDVRLIPLSAQGRLPDDLVRMQELHGELFELSVLEFGLATDCDPDDSSSVLIISNYSEAEGAKIRECQGLLDIDPDIVQGGPVVIPIGPNTVDHDGNFVSVAARSVYAWMKLAGSMIELPEPHVSSGIVDPDDNWKGPPSDRLITIRSSSRRPEDASVAILFKDWWFYISETDARSKDSFRLIKLLFSLRLIPEDSKAQVPVLTVPIN